MRATTILTFLAGLCVGGIGSDWIKADVRDPLSVASDGQLPTDSVKDLLAAFVEDFRSDLSAQAVTFGIEVRDADPSEWHVVVGEPLPNGATPVELHAGLPQRASAYFTTDMESLQRLHAGDIGSLTAMAFSTDFSPLDMKEMEGFKPEAGEEDYLIRLGFHFWTRGFPERVQFGDPELTRKTHGGNAVLFYYQKGFRSGFFQIHPGQHINADPRSRSNPFATLFICTEGSIEARIGDAPCTIWSGEAVYIGPGIEHQFWLPEDAEDMCEGVLLMFGEGA